MLSLFDCVEEGQEAAENAYSAVEAAVAAAETSSLHTSGHLHFGPSSGGWMFTSPCLRARFESVEVDCPADADYLLLVFEVSQHKGASWARKIQLKTPILFL